MPSTLLTPISSFVYSHASQSSYKDETPPDPDASFSSSIPILVYHNSLTPIPYPATRPRARVPRLVIAPCHTASTASLTHRQSDRLRPPADVSAICNAVAAHAPARPNLRRFSGVYAICARLSSTTGS
ncbi:hypothetical protein B0H16DRAFT_1708852 [Mycena metata]|uniref:Uncharacterized protein n=1 Tax=Mycena metata TaxID=1033252 RepID=A0AAD7P1M3_9AGAR|nr:hypothetical protein B0H16DRAFT_1708852 [Mycena metata]